MSEWEFAVDEQLSKDILKLDIDTAYDMVTVQFYFAGQFNGKIPVAWGRYMIGKLRQKESAQEVKE
jgi:hypothetical protein